MWRLAYHVQNGPFPPGQQCLSSIGRRLSWLKIFIPNDLLFHPNPHTASNSPSWPSGTALVPAAPAPLTRA
jgi:hypothetical protein